MKRLLPVLLLSSCAASSGPREVNAPEAPEGSVAIVGATLIDGRGGPPVADSVVVVRGDRIVSAGRGTVPGGVPVVDGRGLTLLPGLMDAHFHLDGRLDFPATWLSRGITSVRDPGAWIESYDAVRKSGAAIPRLFLTGPHLDSPPPAHPKDALLVGSPEEARAAVRRAAAQGASAIKVYYRLPLESIRAAAEEAHRLGLAVTAHLELVDADEAVRAGLDGVEHATSFGTALAERGAADRFREAVARDNRARDRGRYELWSGIRFDRAGPLLALLRERGIFVSPPLAVFERKAPTEVQARACANMLKFVGLCHKAGVTVVAGSHSEVARAERGWAYHRELELLVESGMTPLEAVTAATRSNARFFRAEERLGTVEPGKLADLVLVEGDPSKDIRALRNVKQVMLNGRWVASGSMGGR